MEDVQVRSWVNDGDVIPAMDLDIQTDMHVWRCGVARERDMVVIAIMMMIMMSLRDCPIYLLGTYLPVCLPACLPAYALPYLPNYATGQELG